MSIVFWIFHKNHKKNGNPKIQNSRNSKLSKIVLKGLDFWIFGVFDFCILLKIQKSKTFKDVPKSFEFFEFWFLDFSENIVSALCCINFLVNRINNNKKRMEFLDFRFRSFPN